jgi:hypothetical protein
MISLYKRHRICLKFKLKIKFIYIFRYIIDICIYFIKNKNPKVSSYYDMTLRYDTADKKMILRSIPILKTLPSTPTSPSALPGGARKKAGDDGG